jgi:ubiquinone/menaquinone biosynthesis C-methylase UbiE
MASGTANRSYNAVAWFYETTARWYSRGRIGASKAWQVQHLNSGDRVLYAGVGTGEDALLAARRGAKVTCVDVAPKMLQRAQRRIEAEGLTAEFVCSDIAAVEAAGSFAAVAADYFLNLFDDGTVAALVDHLVAMLRPGGKFVALKTNASDESASAKKPLISRGEIVVLSTLFWSEIVPLFDGPSLVPVTVTVTVAVTVAESVADPSDMV